MKTRKLKSKKVSFQKDKIGKKKKGKEKSFITIINDNRDKTIKTTITITPFPIIIIITFILYIHTHRYTHNKNKKIKKRCHHFQLRADLTCKKYDFSSPIIHTFFVFTFSFIFHFSFFISIFHSHKAIYEYFTLNGFESAAEAFKADSGLTDEDISSIKDKPDALRNALERRWRRIIILQKQQIDNENTIKDLQKQIATYEAIGADGGSIAAAAVAATNLSNAKKKAPVLPRTVKFDLLGHRSSITCVQFHPFLK